MQKSLITIVCWFPRIKSGIQVIVNMKQKPAYGRQSHTKRNWSRRIKPVIVVSHNHEYVVRDMSILRFLKLNFDIYQGTVDGTRHFHPGPTRAWTGSSLIDPSPAHQSGRDRVFGLARACADLLTGLPACRSLMTLVHDARSFLIDFLIEIQDP